MYLDWRLWAFTRGVRLRIAGTVLLGLLAVGAGIARLALLGWLLGRVIAGGSPRSPGPPPFTRSRTCEVILSVVEGVQQLVSYFGQYLPQLAVAALTPPLIFGFVAFVGLPPALVLVPPGLG